MTPTRNLLYSLMLFLPPQYRYWLSSVPPLVRVQVQLHWNLNLELFLPSLTGLPISQSHDPVPSTISPLTKKGAWKKTSRKGKVTLPLLKPKAARARSTEYQYSLAQSYQRNWNPWKRDVGPKARERRFPLLPELYASLFKTRSALFSLSRSAKTVFCLRAPVCLHERIVTH